MIKTPTCRWTEDDGGLLATQCGNYFEITDGTPEENGFKFCCYCGLPLVQFLYEEEPDE